MIQVGREKRDRTFGLGCAATLTNHRAGSHRSGCLLVLIWPSPLVRLFRAQKFINQNDYYFSQSRNFRDCLIISGKYYYLWNFSLYYSASKLETLNHLNQSVVQSEESARFSVFRSWYWRRRFTHGRRLSTGLVAAASSALGHAEREWRRRREARALDFGDGWSHQLSSGSSSSTSPRTFTSRPAPKSPLHSPVSVAVLSLSLPPRSVLSFHAFWSLFFAITLISPRFLVFIQCLKATGWSSLPYLLMLVLLSLELPLYPTLLCFCRIF